MVAIAFSLILSIRSGLQLNTQLALVGIVFTVSWWAFSVIAPAYTSMLMLVFFAASGVAGPDHLFGFWAGPMAWLMIGAYLIARAVTKSGLAKRIATILASKFVNSYTRLVVMIYVLNVALSPIIPLPFPRAFIIMALVEEIMKETKVSEKGRANLGFCVFMGSVPASMMFLTSEAILNPVTAALAGGITWMQWALLMTVPSTVTVILMLVAHFVIFEPVDIKIDPQYWNRQVAKIGNLNADEKRVMTWVGLALLFWVTDFYHGIHPGWISLGAAAGMSLPAVGQVLDESDISSGVDWSALLFATAALAIGTVSEITGLTPWILEAIVPQNMPANVYLILGYIALMGFILHLFVGSVLATLSMLVPPLLSLALQFDIASFAPALLIYTTANLGIALPFHNLMILVGAGEAGGFSEKETMSFFPAQLIIIPITILTQLGWWTLLEML